MKKPTVDYSGFRLRRLNEPRFRHLWLLLGWVAYFVLYFLTENLIPASACHPMHCVLDDLIPFCEYFVVFYAFWYLLVFGSLAYFLLYDVESFKKLQIFLITTQLVAMACYILFPSRQDLRPDAFVRENVFTQLMAVIYAFDTSTGVCPSLHVAYSLGILSVFWKRPQTKNLTRALLLFLAVMISLSTAFVKQHSMVDVLCALPLALLAEAVTFGRSYWRPRWKKQRERSPS